MTRMRLLTWMAIYGAVAVSPLSMGQSVPTGHGAGGSKVTGCGIHCGTERWSLKTLTDADAAGFASAQPTDMKVADLISQAAPKRLPAKSRAPFEKTLVKVRALLIAWKVESQSSSGTPDQDFHIVIADPDDTTKQLIVEVPSPDCQGVCSSTFLDAFKANRDKVQQTLGAPQPTLQTLAKPWLVEITGPAFFDFKHGQDGLAPNCIEIHPVISISFQSQTDTPVTAHAATDLQHTCGSAGGKPRSHTRARPHRTA